jgi:hypothetical protein
MASHLPSQELAMDGLEPDPGGKYLYLLPTFVEGIPVLRSHAKSSAKLTGVASLYG